MERTMKKLLIAAVIAAFPYAASADMTGKELKEFCQQHMQKSEATAMCTGYIWGSFDTARALKSACEPAGVASTRLIDLTIKYLQAHPEELQLSAASLIVNVYKSEFPCPQSPR
jgi:Rap1a immunity proteins